MFLTLSLFFCSIPKILNLSYRLTTKIKIFYPNITSLGPMNVWPRFDIRIISVLTWQLTFTFELFSPKVIELFIWESLFWIFYVLYRNNNRIRIMGLTKTSMTLIAIPLHIWIFTTIYKASFLIFVIPLLNLVLASLHFEFSI